MENLTDLTKEIEAIKKVLNSLILLLEENHSKILKIKTHKTFIKFLKDNIKEIHAIKKIDKRLTSFNRKVFSISICSEKSSFPAFCFSYKNLKTTEGHEFSETTLRDLIEELKEEYLRNKKYYYNPSSI